MYIPEWFREDRTECLQGLIRAHPLATLVTLGQQELVATHLPLVYDPSPEPMGTLRGHLSRANPQWQSFRPEVKALAIFQGPEAYISPSWYPTRQQTGRVVPTWNYAVVHAYGLLETYNDTNRLRKHVTLLTEIHEKNFSPPWSPEDAPQPFIDGLLQAIVGLEIVIRRWEGKWKVSQNRPAEDRSAVVQGLLSQCQPTSTAMAQLVRERAPELRQNTADRGRQDSMSDKQSK